MKKLIVAAAVAAVASLGALSGAQAQAFYPGRTGAPTAGGTYGTGASYPGTYGTYPSYPQQGPAASHRDRDDDDRSARNGRRDDHRRSANDERRAAYDRTSRDTYGTTAASRGTPSRICDHASPVDARGRSRVDPRDARTVRDAWDRR